MDAPGSINAAGFNPNAKRPGEYARYERAEPSGRLSNIFARHETCAKCNLDDVAKIRADAFSKIYHDVSTSHGTMCDYPAVRIIAQGVDPRLRSMSIANAELTYFETGDQLVEFDYVFGSPAPEDNLEAAYASLCPQTPGPSPAPSGA